MDKLEIGEGGEIFANWGQYEITLKNVEYKKDYDGRPPTNDLFVVLTLKYKNTSDKPMKAYDISGSL